MHYASVLWNSSSWQAAASHLCWSELRPGLPSGSRAVRAGDAAGGFLGGIDSCGLRAPGLNRRTGDLGRAPSSVRSETHRAGRPGDGE